MLADGPVKGRQGLHGLCCWLRSASVEKGFSSSIALRPSALTGATSRVTWAGGGVWYTHFLSPPYSVPPSVPVPLLLCEFLDSRTAPEK